MIPTRRDVAKTKLGRWLKDKWLLESIVGVGGMSVVFRARHRNGATVAVKMLDAALSQSELMRARFLREAWLVNRIVHPGVARVLDDDVDDEDGAVFFVMDLLPGIPLSRRYRLRVLDEREVLEVAEQVLDALAAAHREGIIHRDVKPANILVDENGTVHLVDFGIARDTETGGVFTLTSTQRTFGTAGFMAPEQALGKAGRIGERTDLFSLGATMFTLFTGELLHEGETPQELLIATATKPARSVRKLRADASQDFVELVDRATQLDADLRWESAEAMLFEVRRMLRARGVATMCTLRPTGGRKISSRIRAVREVREMNRAAGDDS